ncbi:MAG: type 2 lanthipeptide synthetase LanM family protein [Stanieria sp.]
MNQPRFKNFAWYHAMTLSERTASLTKTSDKKQNLEVNSELAKQRMQRWRKQPPFTDDSFFAQRLEIESITEDEFFYILGEPIETLQERLSYSPDWLINLAEAFSSTSLESQSIATSKEIEGQEISLFLYAIEPLIDRGRQKLQQEIDRLSQTYSDLAFDFKTVLQVLFTNLPGKLLGICSRTLVLELQVASLQGILQGDTTQERFLSFLKHLRQPENIINLLQEYPILARQLTICIEQWVIFSREFLQHLCADWNQIKATFNSGQELGNLVALQGSQGDTHRQGRSVAIAKFSSGFQLVYKPRSLAIDVHFQQLLAWLNQRGNHAPFQTLKILNRDSYGWVEFVTAQSCTSTAEVQRFYERQGGYLALLYALEATDFHNENLIAVGEHPILVDLESLFHPRLTKIDSTQSEQLAREILNHSVLRIGLLPERIWSNGEEYEGVDISGFGSTKGQLSPDKVPYWEGIGTDQMRLKSRRIEMPGKQNLPTLNDTEVNLFDYIDAIYAGFSKIYHLLLKHRAELLAEQGILARFAEDEVRVILRPTMLYALLLRDSFHPNTLRDALSRERLFDRLWLPVEHQPHLVKLIPAEREDLWNGDVPMFTTRPNAHDLFTSSGKRIANFFEQSGMALVKQRLQKLSEEDLAQQIHFIKASLASLAMSSEQAKFANYSLKEPQSIANRKQLLQAAQAIGDRLEKLALRGQDDATWIGLKPIKERYHTLTPLGLDFYDGLPGIILFLAYLGNITQQQRYTSLAQAALITLKRQVEESKPYFKLIGGFDGWGGIIYTFTHLGILWNQPDLLAEAEELVQLLPPFIEEDRGLDIIAGAAGCLVSLLSLYRCLPSESTLTTAIQCGEHLITKAQRMNQGIGWAIPMPNTEPLSGFAHGVAGIAWALLELSAITGEERFRKVALEGIAYERSLFLPQMGNWLDLRNFSETVLSDKTNQTKCMNAWCHGAPGIGLARLCSLPYIDDGEIRKEIKTALTTTLTRGFGYNHSLCHGDLGNLELLLQASQILDDSQWQTQVDQFAAMILESIDKYGWLCGVPLGVETPGLMTGLAGIGYQLMRLAKPEKVPSVLVLEPPKLKDTVQKKAEYAFMT